MAGRASQHEEVPNRVIVGKLLPSEENNAAGVGEAASHQKPEASGGDLFDDGREDGDDEPSHRDVKSGGCPVLAVPSHEGFGQDSSNGKKPNDAENCPSQGAANGHEGEWGVGPRDEKVDRGVVENLEEGLQLMAAEAVVESG